MTENNKTFKLVKNKFLSGAVWLKIKSRKKIYLLIIIFVAGGLFSHLFYQWWRPVVIAENLRLDDQEATVRAIKKIMPVVVSIAVRQEQEVATVELSTGEKKVIKEKKVMGSGTGFLISPDGLIITNKHVVNAGEEGKAEYRITLSNDKQYYAQLIGKDPVNDLAILKIFDRNLPYAELGDSSKLTPGLTVIAIGNALGIYQNSVTRGIVSGLGRDIVASDRSGNSEALGNIIQTDADINFGNSGGPLIDLSGQVVGINAAIDLSGSKIGFAIPINDAKPVIDSARVIGRIIRPRLGVRYQMLNQDLAEENNLPRSSGAWVNAGDKDKGEVAVVPASPAAKAGILDGDIIFEVDGQKLDSKNTLSSVVQRFKPGKKLGLKIQRGKDILVKIVELDEFK